LIINTSMIDVILNYKLHILHTHFVEKNMITFDIF